MTVRPEGRRGIDGEHDRDTVARMADRGSATASAAGVVEVAVPLAPQLGCYSYRTDQNPNRLVGRAVRVPFGEREDWGVVVGEGDPAVAERRILEVGPQVLSAAEVELARWAALRWCGLDSQTALRAIPKEILRQAHTTQGRGADRRPQGSRRLQYRLCAPGLDMTEAAAAEISRLAAEQNRRILVLCPTQQDVAGVVAACSVRPEDGLVVGLSGSSMDAAVEGWGRGRGRARILVGTRHHGLWPVRNLGAVVVVDAEHPGHRSPSQPYTNSGDLAVRRAQLTGASCVLLGRVPDAAALWGGVKVVEAGSKQRHWPQLQALRYNPDVGGGFGARIRDLIAQNLSSGRRVAVVVPGGAAGWVCAQCRREWKCRRCGEWVRVGGCSCEQRPNAPRCDHCTSTRRVVRGWDERRAGRELEKTPAGWEFVPRSEMWGMARGVFDLVVYAEADEGWGSGADPGLEAVRGVVAAAELTKLTGRLILHNVRRGGAVDDLVARRSVYGVVRKNWELARSEHLPPFGREVVVVMTGPKPDRPDLGVRAHGPRRHPEGWEVVLRCDDADLERVRAWVQQMRRDRRRRLRVTVN